MDIHSYEEDSVWYSPDYKENRDLPDDQQFSVCILPMSRKQLHRLEEKHSQLSRSGKVNYIKRYNKMRTEILSSCITEVHHLTLVVSKGGVKSKVAIESSDDLIKYAPDEILDDILSSIKDQSLMEEGIAGKSDSQSDTSI